MSYTSNYVTLWYYRQSVANPSTMEYVGYQYDVVTKTTVVNSLSMINNRGYDFV